LSAGEQLPPNVEESVRMIHESVELEVQLIDDLLDLTKIARYARALCVVALFAASKFSTHTRTRHSNKLKLAFSEVSVHALLTRTLQIVAHDAAVKSIAVTLDTSAINDRVDGDPARSCSPSHTTSAQTNSSPRACAMCHVITGSSRCFGTLSR
jgi:signal transduction histidine kinase